MYLLEIIIILKNEISERKHPFKFSFKFVGESKKTNPKNPTHGREGGQDLEAVPGSPSASSSSADVLLLLRSGIVLRSTAPPTPT